MKNFYFFLISIFVQILNNQQIIENPIQLSNTENPLVLSTNDDDYYYVIAKGKSLKIHKESGNTSDISDNEFTSSNYIHLFDNSNNNYIYNSNKYFEIKYNPFFSFEEITVNSKSQISSVLTAMTIVGSIAQNNEFIVYGYCDDQIHFSSKSREYRASYDLNYVLFEYFIFSL